MKICDCCKRTESPEWIEYEMTCSEVVGKVDICQSCHRAGQEAWNPAWEKTYDERVAELEAEGLTTSDAQGVADAELMQGIITD